MVLLVITMSTATRVHPIRDLPVTMGCSGAVRLVFPSTIGCDRTIASFITISGPRGMPRVLHVGTGDGDFDGRAAIDITARKNFFCSFGISCTSDLRRAGCFLPNVADVGPSAIFVGRISRARLVTPRGIVCVSCNSAYVGIDGTRGARGVVHVVTHANDIRRFPGRAGISFTARDNEFFAFGISCHSGPSTFMCRINRGGPRGGTGIVLASGVVPTNRHSSIVGEICGTHQRVFGGNVIHGGVIFSLGGLRVCSGLLLFAFRVRGGDHLPCSVSCVQCCVISHGATGLATSRRISRRTLFSRGCTPHVRNGSGVGCIVTFSGFAVPSSGFFHVRVGRGGNNHRILFSLRGDSVMGISRL